MTKRLLAASLTVLALAGCRTAGDLVVDDSVGVTAIRGACPAVGVPDYTGDMTLFTEPGRTDSGAIDVVAAITNVRSACNDTADRVYAGATFDVLARRTDVRGARQVQLPYFVTVLRGGTAVISKRIGTVTISFADGQERAQASAQAGAFVDRAEATLPQEIRDRITRRRRAGDTDAAVDPMSDPEVRAAVARASFEMLIGFQLDERQIAYNATR